MYSCLCVWPDLCLQAVELQDRVDLLVEPKRLHPPAILVPVERDLAVFRELDDAQRQKKVLHDGFHNFRYQPEARVGLIDLSDLDDRYQ